METSKDDFFSFLRNLKDKTASSQWNIKATELISTNNPKDLAYFFNLLHSCIKGKMRKGFSGSAIQFIKKLRGRIYFKAVLDYFSVTTRQRFIRYTQIA